MSNLKPKRRLESKRDAQGNLRANYRETGVEPTYQFSDVKAQASSLSAYFHMWNAYCENTKGMEHRSVDPQEPIRSMLKRVSKFYNADNKYNADGSVRSSYFK